MIFSFILKKLYLIKQFRRYIYKIFLVSRKNQFDNSDLIFILARYHNIKIGSHSYGGCFNLDNISPGTIIGKFCSFGNNAVIISNDHLKSAITTHPFLFKPSFGLINHDVRREHQITIGNDVWIGYNVTILPSVSTIGDGAIVAAGSIVTKDIPPFAVVAGVPAKIIKFRFSNDTINHLLNIRWWDWPDNKIFSNYKLFYDPEKFISNFKNKNE